MQVRRTVSSLRGGLGFTEPEIRGSRAGDGMSSRVVAALAVERERQDADRAAWGEAYTDHGPITGWCSPGRTAGRCARSTS